MSESNELPKGWAKARVDSLVQLVNGFAFKPTQWKSEGLPIIRIQNLNNKDAPFNYCPEDLPDKIRVRNGDLLFAWSGTPGTSFGAHIWRGQDAWLNQHIFKVNFNREYLDERYLRLAINQNLDSYIRQAHGGAGLAHITKGRFEESRLPIAPLPEQSRIVAKIEELFSDLDAGVAALKRAKANLKRYRASVLKAAVEGKLTEQWRAKHPAKEPASALLARILKERRLKWEADQLAKFAAAKKEPPKNWRDKYVEPTLPDTNGLPELPEGWCWASVEQLVSEDRHSLAIGPFGSNLKVPDYRESGVPLIFVRNIRSGMFGGDGTKFVTAAKAMELNAHSTEAGDILITKMGEPPGDACLYPQGSPKAIITADCIKVRLHPLLPDARLVVFAINSDTVRKQVVEITKGVALQKVNLERFSTIAIPLSPRNEQHEIINEVATKLSQIDAAEKQIEHGLIRAARLRQSILKRAFEGKLVPQDPKDEPASALLERLRASRTHDEANGTAATSKRTRAKIKESSGEPRTRIRRRPSS